MHTGVNSLFRLQRIVRIGRPVEHSLIRSHGRDVKSANHELGAARRSPIDVGGQFRIHRKDAAKGSAPWLRKENGKDNGAGVQRKVGHHIIFEGTP